jgi:hypothetical protein
LQWARAVHRLQHDGLGRGKGRQPRHHRPRRRLRRGRPEHQQQYGLWEVRARFPRGAGTKPCILLWPGTERDVAARPRDRTSKRLTRSKLWMTRSRHVVSAAGCRRPAMLYPRQFLTGSALRYRLRTPARGCSIPALSPLATVRSHSVAPSPMRWPCSISAAAASCSQMAPAATNRPILNEAVLSWWLRVPSCAWESR